MNRQLLRAEYDLEHAQETVEILAERLDRALEAIQVIEDLTVPEYGHSAELTLALIRNHIRFFHVQEKNK